MSTEQLDLQDFGKLVGDDSNIHSESSSTGVVCEAPMSLVAGPVTAPTSRSFLERFIESFLHPNNIQWMLLLGAAIILASSLMLVTKEWSHWPAAVKYAAILGYTAAIYCFSEIADRRMGLKSTSNVLRCLTIVLIPIMMLGLNWIATQDSWICFPNYIEYAILLVPSLGLLYIAGRNISSHFLRGDQPTFFVCYALLSVAGSFPVASGSETAFLWIVGCWLVMTVGAIKVYRHVFWLTEEHNLPRICGFLPILLLGSQFLMLAGTKAVQVCPAEWIGTFLVLFAATILITTRSVAKVFRERTGDLVRPLPWSIGLPLAMGVLMTFAGVVLSCWGFTFTGVTTTYAIVPTAILAATLMALVAFDTCHPAFTWLSILLIVIAYQASPVFIKDLITTLRAGAASAIHEDRLPIAFYGVTYLPLLVLMTIASRLMRQLRRTNLSKPLQQFVTFAATLLWFSSLFNIKAMFLVSTIYVIAMIGFGIAFRDRRYAYVSLIVALVAVTAYVPYSDQMMGTHSSYVSYFLNLSVFGLVLYSSRIVDQCLAMIPLPQVGFLCRASSKNDVAKPVAYSLGMVLLLGLTCVWVAGVLLTTGGPIRQNEVTISLLLMSAISLIVFRSQNYLSSMLFAVALFACSTRYLVGHGMQLQLILEHASVICTFVSLIAIGLVRWTASSESSWSNSRKAFGIDLNTGDAVPVLKQFLSGERILNWLRCHVIALGDLATFVVIFMSIFMYAPSTFLAATNVTGVDRVAWQSAFIVGWLVACSAILNSRMAAIALSIFTPLYVAGAINTFFPSSLSSDQLPVIFAIVSGIICGVCHYSGKIHLREACFVSRLWLGAIASVSFVYLAIPIRVAGAIAIGTLLVAKGRVRIAGEKVFIAIVCNVHLLLFIAGLSGAHGWLLDRETLRQIASMAAILFPSLTLSILIADRWLTQLGRTAGYLWTVVLIAMSLFCFGVVLVDGILRWELQLLVLAGITFAAFTATVEGIRMQAAAYAWLSLLLLGVGLLWLWDQALLSV